MRYLLQLIAVSSVLLTGCKTTELNKEASFNEASQNGLVVVSLTHSEPLQYNRASIFYGAIDKAYLESLKGLDATFIDTSFMRQYPVTNDFQKTFGKLVVAELPPNTYEITRVRYTMDMPVGKDKEFDFIHKRDARPTFDIKAGEVTYLGEYNVTARDKKYMPILKISTDNKQRDFKVLEKKYPNVQNYKN